MSDEDQRELSPELGAVTAVLWGLMLEGLDGGAFSIGAWALKSLAFAAVLLAWTVLWRRYQARVDSAEDRSNPLM